MESRRNEKSGVLFELREEIKRHEEQAKIYEDYLFDGDFETNRIRWANELVKIERLRLKLRDKESRSYNMSTKMRGEKYLSI
jgi:hypothetical protein